MTRWLQLSMNIGIDQEHFADLEPVPDHETMTSLLGEAVRTVLQQEEILIGYIQLVETTPPRLQQRLSSNDTVDYSQARQWARENGFSVSNGGRLPKHIKDAYLKSS